MRCWGCPGPRFTTGRCRCVNRRCGSWPGSTPSTWRILAAVAAGSWTTWPEKGFRSAATGCETSCAAWVYGRSTRNPAPRSQESRQGAIPAWWISGWSPQWIRSGPPTSLTSRCRKGSSTWWRSWICSPETFSAGSSPTALTLSSVSMHWRWHGQVAASQRSSTQVDLTKNHPRRRLDKSFAWIQCEKKRRIRASGMTRSRPTLFMLRSGQSGLGFSPQDGRGPACPETSIQPVTGLYAILTESIIFMSFLLTIVIPTYNRTGLCMEQINRVAEWIFKYERHSTVEVIVLDNASTQNTDGLTQLCRHHGIRYHYSYMNVGASGNFCRASQAGASEYLWLLSDDDIVSIQFFDMVYQYINSDQPPDVVGVSLEMAKPLISGKAKDVFHYLLSTNILAITSLTLVSSTIFRRSLFNCATFWRYEPWWFPHSFSIYGEALRYNVECIVIRGGKGLLAESGNTAKERIMNHSLSHSYRGLNMQFQTALLDFINMFSEQCERRLVTKDEYIQEVISRFKCDPAAIQSGMAPIHSL